ncbi:glyoxal oxidase [Flagelloscypha sp. PMI_526]|nr:glyoxal oxidase [Flagelloscypha sp. PMI_526]
MSCSRAAVLLALSLNPFLALAQTLSAPGQPTRSGKTPNTFDVIGSSLVSAQQIFLAGNNKVYFVDKVENNPSKINGHPAWASDWSLSDDKQRPMDIVTNSFCAGGNVMADGTWLNVGGNQAVKENGDAAESQTGGGVYDDPDGRNSIRTLKPCDSGTCDWKIAGAMTTRRWYPTLETLATGDVIILGGCQYGGYVNAASQDNPTVEFYPSRGNPKTSEILATTLPVNLYPLTWLLPSGQLLVQSNWKTVLMDPTSLDEKPLADMVDAVRTYPASAATAMLPLTPANNWTATVIFCGGTNLQSDEWVPAERVIINLPTETSCVRITPDVSPDYEQDDPMLEGRSMVNFIFMPDGKLFLVNGATTGTAGYGLQDWVKGMSYADGPRLTPAIYDPNAAPGSRWNRDGLPASTIPRMYHSSATLLPDGAIFISGSNPNSDFRANNTNYPYPTEYRTELFYPWYYSKRRPQPNGLLQTLSYGGDPFNVYLSADDLSNNVENLNNTKVVIIRTGFSTHNINMGQRFLQLDSTFTGYKNNTGVLHVSQLPPNPNILAPGPAHIFVTVNGVPSVGMQVMIGSGKVEKQVPKPIGSLPDSVLVVDASSSSSSHGNSAQSTRSTSITSLFSFGLLALLSSRLL